MSSNKQDEFRVRSYMLLHTLEYLRNLETQKGLDPQIPDEIQRAVAKMGPADWCPGSWYVDIANALAKTANGDETRAKDLLIDAGTHVARTATNTFLRLLMKMLTPALFAKKMPDFWKRDCTLGSLEVEVSDRKIFCRLVDMEGFDHAVCTGAGFASYALQGMGKSVNSLILHDWSLAKPYVNGTSFEITWTN